jgi:hypothetical protein
MGLYVYAVGKSDDDEPPPLQGVLDKPAYRLDAGPFCVIVSECPLPVVRAERRHIAAMQRVLAALNTEFDFLPMAFGTVTKSVADLRCFLDEHQETLMEQLQRITGAVEMGLRLSLEVSDPIAYLVERTPALKTARERIFRSHRTPSYDDKIRLGQMVDQALNRYREARTAEVMNLVSASCAEVMTLPVHKEKEIANLAALVPRPKRDQFEAAVHASAAQIDEDIAFNISGPWPPYNFVQFEQTDQ